MYLSRSFEYFLHDNWLDPYSNRQYARSTLSRVRSMFENHIKLPIPTSEAISLNCIYIHINDCISCIFIFYFSRNIAAVLQMREENFTEKLITETVVY